MLDMADLDAMFCALNVQHVARRGGLEGYSFGKALPTTSPDRCFVAALAGHCKLHFPADPLGAWLFAGLALSCTGLVCRRLGCGFFRLWPRFFGGIVYGSVSLTFLSGIGSLFPRRIAPRRTRAMLGSLIQPITRITQISEQLAAEVQQVSRRQRGQVFLIDLFQVVISQLPGCYRTKVSFDLQIRR